MVEALATTGLMLVAVTVGTALGVWLYRRLRGKHPNENGGLKNDSLC